MLRGVRRLSVWGLVMAMSLLALHPRCSCSHSFPPIVTSMSGVCLSFPTQLSSSPAGLKPSLIG